MKSQSSLSRHSDLFSVTIRDPQRFLGRNHSSPRPCEFKIGGRRAERHFPLPARESGLARTHRLARDEVLIIGFTQIELRVERDSRG